MKIHDLKSWPIPFMHVRDGIKRFEVRRNDRNYERGDLVVLREFVPDEATAQEFIDVTGICDRKPVGLTGYSAGPFEVGYVESSVHVPEGYCVFELIPLAQSEWP